MVIVSVNFIDYLVLQDYLIQRKYRTATAVSLLLMFTVFLKIYFLIVSYRKLSLRANFRVVIVLN